MHKSFAERSCHLLHLITRLKTQTERLFAVYVCALSEQAFKTGPYTVENTTYNAQEKITIMKYCKPGQLNINTF